MPVHNRDVAKIFYEVADLLDIQDANPFRIRAYRGAAQTIENLSGSVADRVEEGEDLSELPGIGDDLAAKIQEIVESGSLQQLEELRAEAPAGLVDALDISGLGPKRVKKLHDALGIKTLDDLEEAARAERVEEVEGFGEKTQQKILDQIADAGEGEDRTRLVEAEQIAEPLLAYLEAVEGVDRVEIAGSYRRRRATVGDLDILVTADETEKIMERFVQFEDVEDVASRGDTRSTVKLRGGMQVDLRAVDPESYGAALYYFTGSKSHNIAVRERGVDRGLKINEYGVFDAESDERIGGESEDDVFESVGLPYIVPELRENRGEIDAAEEGALPDLVELDDLRGDLQCHSTWSDGTYSIEEMARAARDLGRQYLAITDHSKSETVANGLDVDRVSEQIDEIEALNDELDGIRILLAIEVDIMEDGSLDLPDDLLGRLDLTVCSIHSKMDLAEDAQTERIIRAMDNPHFNILAHPTGRLIGERAPYAVDMGRVLEAAKARGCFLEINASPKRLDLNDIQARMAKDIGVKLAISTDAHRTSELEFMRFGVDQARRGWLTADDVLNTRPWDELRSLLER